jgi:hypothetical protein
MQFRESPMFRRKVSPPSSWAKGMEHKKPVDAGSKMLSLAPQVSLPSVWVAACSLLSPASSVGCVRNFHHSWLLDGQQIWVEDAKRIFECFIQSNEVRFGVLINHFHA